MTRRVEGIESAGAAHVHAERKRLAARAGAEIDDHLAASRADERSDQLAAFVLHLDVAALEDLERLQRRFARHAQAVRCPARRRRLDTLRGELVLDLFALGAQRVHPQVEWRRTIERVDERSELLANGCLQ